MGFYLNRSIKERNGAVAIDFDYTRYRIKHSCIYSS